jgi:hypothetical protein
MLDTLIQLLIKTTSIYILHDYTIKFIGTIWKEVTMTATSKYYQKVQGQILFLGSNNVQMDQPLLFLQDEKWNVIQFQSLLNQTKLVCIFYAPKVFTNTNQSH